MRAPYAREPQVSPASIRGIGIAILGVFLFFVLCLWRLQVVKGGEYLLMARGNSVRIVRKPAPRGLIYDRGGRVLVDNRAGFDVEVVPEDIKEGALLELRLARLLGIDTETLRGRLRGNRSYAYLPVTAASDVNMETVLSVEERQPALAGVQIGVYPRRRYLHGALAAHLIGSLGMISRGELDTLGPAWGYTAQDLIGKTGVEKECERYLAGSAGEEGIQVDNRGCLDRVLYRRDPVPGAAVYLTIDAETQREAEAVLSDGEGAVVALDPRNGEVLAMASSPAYDPNVFIPPVKSECIRALASAEGHPLVNRAIQGLYQPGSTIKPIVALAALESGVIKDGTTFTCTGAFYLGRHSYRCWYEKGHGTVNLLSALMFSCNVFFYNAGYRTGRDAMARMACEFGIDERTGIDLPGELAGVVPTAAWQKEARIGPWNPGDTVVMAIGQGYLQVTPLRAAVVMGAIANGGVLYKPRVVRQVVSPLGETVELTAPEIDRRITPSRADLALVREGLRRVVNSPYGTGQKARLADVAIAGKTGTVQVGPEENRRNHAWFVGYAPFDDPRIVVAVLLEGRKSGGYFAAPAARRIFAAFLDVSPAEAPPPRKQ